MQYSVANVVSLLIPVAYGMGFQPNSNRQTHTSHETLRKPSVVVDQLATTTLHRPLYMQLPGTPYEN